MAACLLACPEGERRDIANRQREREGATEGGPRRRGLLALRMRGGVPPRSTPAQACAEPRVAARRMPPHCRQGSGGALLPAARQGAAPPTPRAGSQSEGSVSTSGVWYDCAQRGGTPSPAGWAPRWPSARCCSARSWSWTMQWARQPGWAHLRCVRCCLPLARSRNTQICNGRLVEGDLAVLGTAWGCAAQRTCRIPCELTAPCGACRRSRASWAQGRPRW
eukprot:COSAG02_NODE_505_length_20935_cov_38.509119_9_plen_221_part_00